jgi:regulation of enolase protein 1 (concanavalin A-like superfamily)
MSTIHPRVLGGLASCALACLLAVPILADAQEKAGLHLKGWGQPVDPDGDCGVALEDGAVVIKIPGVAHDFASDIRLQNSPRVLSRVKGDFVVEVKVSGGFKPGATSVIPGRLPYHGAGLLLVKDKDNYISLHRGCVYINNNPRHYANFELRKDGDLAISKYEIEIPDQDTYLRLERRGDQVYNATSPDGVHWTSYEPIALELPETVQLGVVGISSSDVPLSVKFRDLAVFRKAEVE